VIERYRCLRHSVADGTYLFAHADGIGLERDYKQSVDPGVHESVGRGRRVPGGGDSREDRRSPVDYIYDDPSAGDALRRQELFHLGDRAADAEHVYPPVQLVLGTRGKSIEINAGPGEWGQREAPDPA
jgi:hypothetical protein